jgi:hypothetical protein
MLEQAAPEAEAFAAAVPAAGGDGATPRPIGRLAATSGGRGRGSAGKSRKPRG